MDLGMNTNTLESIATILTNIAVDGNIQWSVNYQPSPLVSCHNQSLVGQSSVELHLV